jgi:hypothetical protein
METAEIKSNLIPIMYSEREDDNTKWLTVSVPNGWDDCKKITKKVLSYRNETYVWRGWNSDSNKAFFAQSNEVANIK